MIPLHYAISLKEHNIVGDKTKDGWMVKVYSKKSVQTLNLTEDQHRHWLRVIFDASHEPPIDVQAVFEVQLTESRVNL